MGLVVSTLVGIIALTWCSILHFRDRARSFLAGCTATSGIAALWYMSEPMGKAHGMVFVVLVIFW